MCTLLQSIHESCQALSHFSMWLKHDPFFHNDHHAPPLSRAFVPSIIRSQTTPTSPAIVNNPCFSIRGVIIDIHGKIVPSIDKLTFPFLAYGPSTKCSNETQVSKIITSSSWGSSLWVSSSIHVYKLYDRGPTWSISSSYSIIVASATSSIITTFYSLLAQSVTSSCSIAQPSLRSSSLTLFSKTSSSFQIRGISSFDRFNLFNVSKSFALHSSKPTMPCRSAWPKHKASPLVNLFHHSPKSPWYSTCHLQNLSSLPSLQSS